ncbi:MAG: COX15/CtaA family protein [Anaerolineales bacterium]|nr:COX15/CtaA family protein [Anaerolineales bacterium]
MGKGQKRFARYAWVLVAYTIAVILWGAFVRATGSGAGCGAHWPSCQGDIIPRPESIETVIEFTHRLMSGLFGILILALVVGAFRVFPKGHMVRKTAVLSLIFTFTESLLGAGLVLFELVAYNVSAERAVAAALHLTNTYFLLGFVVLTAWWSSRERPARVRLQGTAVWLLGIGLAAMIILSAAGAITALGDTIFPAQTLAHGLQQDVDPAAHFLVRLRIWHPMLSILTGFYLFYISGIVMEKRPLPDVHRFGTAVRIVVITQVIAGGINVILLAPVWLQMLHLLLADLLWLNLVLLAATALAVPAEAPNDTEETEQVPRSSLSIPR